MTIKHTLTALAMALAATPLAAQEEAAPPAEVSEDMRVTLLGTGTPTLNLMRFGAANLVQAGGLNLLFDAGRGASIRLQQLGETPGTMDAVFLTHLHSDHVNGLADIYTTGYIVGATLKGRTEPFELYGPTGTQELMDGIKSAHRWDAETRIIDEGVPEAAPEANVHEAEEGVIFDENGVQVTMFPVNHGENITSSVGYRVDYNGHSVVFSGDTTYDENIVTASEGVDLLVHENGMATAELMEREAIQKIMAHHTDPVDVGRIFAAAAPQMAVYNHMVLLGGAPISEVITKTRETYDGPLVIGEDMMQFVISDGGLSMLSAGQ
ncbi:MBL fold metallo-hydrolase [Paracoccaceae bacterium GXU_MW_L88]